MAEMTGQQLAQDLAERVWAPNYFDGAEDDIDQLADGVRVGLSLGKSLHEIALDILIGSNNDHRHAIGMLAVALRMLGEQRG